jgi:DNA-binding MarR family transcriptional regulator
MKQLDLDITSVQFAALSTLLAHQQLEQSQLASLIAYDKATIGGVITRMEKKGWINRIQSDTDKRAKLVTLTPEGLSLLTKLTPVVEGLQTVILQNLSPIEQQSFMQLARKAL